LKKIHLSVDPQAIEEEITKTAKMGDWGEPVKGAGGSAELVYSGSIERIGTKIYPGTAFRGERASWVTLITTMPPEALSQEEKNQTEEAEAFVNMTKLLTCVGFEGGKRSREQGRTEREVPSSTFPPSKAF